MKTLEVDSKNWTRFYQKLEEFCRGAMVTIQLEDRDGTKSVVAENVPLRHMAFDKQADPCNASLIIEAGADNQKPVRHTVLEPIHVWLKNGTAPARYNQVQILAENGTTTIRLQPGLNEALLRGLNA
jgi:hypothetical protein